MVSTLCIVAGILVHVYSTFLDGRLVYEVAGATWVMRHHFACFDFKMRL